jgi:hypothetical protein
VGKIAALGGLLCLSFLSACGGAVIMKGYVNVPEPGGQIQKVQVTCRPIYNTNTQTFDLTGLSLPVTSVIKPSIAGISTGITPSAVSDQLHGLDLQQIAICESLILDPNQSDMRQTLKDYVGVTGYLTLQIRTLTSSTSAAQYQIAANNLSTKPATVAPSTAGEVNKTPTVGASNQPLSAPPLQTFPAQPSLTAPPAPTLPARAGRQPST